MKLHLRAYTITMRPYMQVVHRCTSVKPLTHTVVTAAKKQRPSRRPVMTSRVSGA